MSTRIRMEFKKGDGTTHYFRIPTDAWSAGGTLFFAAKPEIDNDATDAAAVIDVSFSDADIVGSGSSVYLAGYQTYTCYFAPADIVNVSFADGETEKTYLGEWQFVPLTGIPSSFPDDDGYIKVIIYGDVKRAVS